MNNRLFDFQRTTIEKLQQGFKLLWNVQTEKPLQLLFKAPTGSGKTIVTSAFIDSLQSESPFLPLVGDVAFVWITFGENLAMQSKEKFYNSFFPNLRNTLSTNEDCGDVLCPNEILFINWEKLSQTRGTDRLKLRRPQNEIDKKESGVYFEDIIEKTKEQKRKIILIIDESHSHSDTVNSQNLIDIISPKLIFNMSATPFKSESEADAFYALKGRGVAEIVEIARQDVVDAGLIKEEIRCQTEEDLERFDGANIDEVMLDLAIEKRNQIKSEWEKIGLNINPLCLIQLPNDDNSLNDGTPSKEEFTMKYLKRRGISETRIGKWLDKTPVKKEWRLTDNDSEIDFLLFKLAAGTGWDCPRAHVLVMFREIKSPVFHAQTLGRIVRMACLDDEKLNGHPMLRTGYLYTTYERNKVAESITLGTKNKQKVFVSKLDNDIKKKMVIETFSNDMLDLFSDPLTILNEKIIVAVEKKEITDDEAILPEIKPKVVSEIIDSIEIEMKNQVENLYKEDNKLNLEIPSEDMSATEVKISNNKINYVVQDAKLKIFEKIQEKFDVRNSSPVFQQAINEIIQESVETTAGARDTELILDPVLKSDFLSRTDYGDLGKTSEFQKTFKASMHNFFGTNGQNSFGESDKESLLRFNIDLEPTLNRNMMVNEIFRDENDYDTNEDSLSKAVNVSDNDASHYFTLMCMEILRICHIGNIARSWNPLKIAIVQWAKQLDVGTDFSTEDWYRIIVKDFDKNANSVFLKAIVKAIENYKPIRDEFLKEKEELAKDNRSKPFRIKTEYAHTTDCEIYTPSAKSCVQPFYLLKEYNGRENEIRFIEYLEGKNDVKNWFKNGSRGKEDFCIRYYNSEQDNFDGFYPDWIVIYENGDIGIYDTKSGITGMKQSQETRDKADALHKKIDWLNQHSKHHYIGGIMELIDGEWKITSGKE